MKVVILAGGFGTRLSEYTESIPKPMVSIGGKPILWHIMKSYAAQGFDDFIVAVGYKGEVIKDFFVNYGIRNSDLDVDLVAGTITLANRQLESWKIKLVDTGQNTLTGGRLGRLRKLLGDEPFMLTYGDAVSDVNIQGLLDFHNSHGKWVTVTAVHPPARFGELDLLGDQVVNFKEKPQVNQGWINGGFFVIKPEFLSLIDGDTTILEREPLEKVATTGELMAFRHDGFWHCMDVKRDRDALEELWDSGKRPWVR
jgi:glucose-1-phosphate cytidylyltransferase